MRAMMYVGRHSIAFYKGPRCIDTQPLSPEEQEAIAHQLLRHASDRRKNGDLPVKYQEKWTSSGES